MFRTLRRSLLALCLATATVGMVGTVTTSDAQAASTATDFIKGKHETVVKLLKTPKSADRDKKIDAELTTLVDYDEMAKAAVGVNWDKRSDAEKKEFTELLRQLVDRNYRKRLEQTLDYNVTYKGEKAQGSDTLVQTEAANAKDLRAPAVMIDYVLRKKGSGFIVVDIVPEGASYVKVYNKEITKILDKNGWDAVIKKMKDKLAKT